MRAIRRRMTSASPPRAALTSSCLPGTICAARSLRLVLHGANKREAMARLLAVEDVDPEWPASIVHEHDDAEIWVDRAALG
jgi:6-phosphogluconolactonase/glucosamine-6-phosphate isomerase/deaminase